MQQHFFSRSQHAARSLCQGLHPRMPRAAALWASLAVVTVLSACSSPAQRIAVYDFGPGATAPQPSNRMAPLPPLLLADVEAASALDGTAVLYRLAYADVQQLRPYAQARWSMPPAQLLRQRPERQPAPVAVTHAAQGLQHLDGQLELPASSTAAPRHPRQKTGQVSRNHRAEQHDDPGHVDPDQQDRHCRKSPVNSRVGRHRIQINGQQLLGHLNAGRDKQSADKGVAPLHRRIGHVAVERSHATSHQEELKHIEHQLHATRQRPHHPS